MMPNHWIESIGLPGAGKSTLTIKHSDAIREQYKLVESRSYNKINSLYTIIASKIIASQIGGDWKLAQKLAYRLSFRWHRKRREKIFFFDSGLAQVILENLIETDFSVMDLKLNWLSQARLSSTLLYFHDDIDAILSREAGRADRRFPDINESELHKRYHRAQTAIEQQIIPMFNQVIKINPLTEDLSKVLKQ